MIVVDASALMAILESEEDARTYAEAILDAGTPLISAATLLETGIVMLNRHGEKATRKVDDLVAGAPAFRLNRSRRTRCSWHEMPRPHTARGRSAAGLNFGDCFSYALAKATDFPLLFKGRDFAATDVQSALDAG